MRKASKMNKGDKNMQTKENSNVTETLLEAIEYFKETTKHEQVAI